MNANANSIQVIPVLAGKEMPMQTVESIDDAFAKFTDFAQQHAALLSSCQETWSDEERAYRVGFTVEFRSSKSIDSVTIHATDEGGIAECQLDNRLRLTQGSFESEEIVAFLHPEWTEFVVSELTTYDFLIQALKKWEETGVFPAEFLR